MTPTYIWLKRTRLPSALWHCTVAINGQPTTKTLCRLGEPSSKEPFQYYPPNQVPADACILCLRQSGHQP